MCKLSRFLFFALLLAGCDQSEDFESERLDLDGAVDAEPSQTLAAEMQGLAAPEGGPQPVPYALVVGECPGATRLIGVLDPSAQDCTLGGTVPAEWSAVDLFEAGSPGVAGLSNGIPAELGRYCAFDYVGPEGAVASHYASLTTSVNVYPHMDALTLSADCRGEYEQGDLYDPSIGEQLRASLLENIAWSSGTALVGGDASEERKMTEVAVVDTVSQAAANDPNVDPVSPHGLQMAALIREVDCPAGESNCLDAVHHVLALPRDEDSFEPNWLAGGRHGSQGDLAMGIYESVQAWRERRLADSEGASPRLVINLSVGWTGLDGEPLESARGPHAAVLAAARYASCHGVLMIAAAGNADNELCPGDSRGPLAPARFEALAAPTQAECAALGYAPEWTENYPVFPAGEAGYRPLVHAVAAVDEYDAPLLNARDASSSRLVALGSTGITDPAAEVLAGSSVAAALTSGTAAMLWSFRPDLRAEQIMELIHSTAWDTGRSADFGLAGPIEGVRRLAVCPALAAACEGGDAEECPTPTCSANAPASDGNLGNLATAVSAVLDDPQTSVEVFESVAAIEYPVCGTEAEGATDLTCPQLELPLCPRCDLGKGNFDVPNDDHLSMTIDPSYAGMITAAALITSDGQTRTYRRLEPEVIESLNRQPEPVDITSVRVDAPDAELAALRFELVDGSSQTNEIRVYHRGE